jgi:hypothetical protein
MLDGAPNRTYVRCTEAPRTKLAPAFTSSSYTGGVFHLPPLIPTTSTDCQMIMIPIPQLMAALHLNFGARGC